MATIKQVEKQIETANRNIAGFEKRISMYTDRMNKAIAKLNAQGANITAADIQVTETKVGRHTSRDFRLPKSIVDAYDWTLTYKVVDNRRALDENEHNREREIRHRDELMATHDKMVNDAQAHEQATTGLKQAMEQAMADFRIVWFNKMLTWHGEHYNHINAILPATITRRERAQACQNYFVRKRGWRFESSRMGRYLTKTIKGCNETIFDDAAKMEFGEYMTKAEQDITKSWNNGIDLLTDKCHKFGLDEQAIEVTHPSMTSKGFSAIIRDGKSRIVNVRIIWAAEYSFLVTPHIRYIATSKAIG